MRVQVSEQIKKMMVLNLVRCRMSNNDTPNKTKHNATLNTIDSNPGTSCFKSGILNIQPSITKKPTIIVMQLISMIILFFCVSIIKKIDLKFV